MAAQGTSIRLKLYQLPRSYLTTGVDIVDIPTTGDAVASPSMVLSFWHRDRNFISPISIVCGKSLVDESYYLPPDIN